MIGLPIGETVSANEVENKVKDTLLLLDVGRLTFYSEGSNKGIVVTCLKPSTAKRNGKFWSARARDWANIQEGTLKPVFHAALELAGVGANTQYLDIGCGAGMAAAMAARRGAQVSGLDAAHAMIRIARIRTPKGDFRNGDIEALPFDDNTFDVVTAINALQYAGNPGLALKEAVRVTRPGGKIVIVTWGSADTMEATRLNASLKPLMAQTQDKSKAATPFALSTRTDLLDFVSDAGLFPEAFFEVEAPWSYPDHATALRGVTSPGVVVQAMETLGKKVVLETYAQTLEQFRQADGSYRIGANFRGLLTTRP